tara:strand:+ start:985 stop:1422 length:438 start_codon:yes stop_codon:yes gene_type:complete
MIILPFVLNAQSFNPPKIQPSSNFSRTGLEPRPKVPEITPTLKPLSRSHVENAKAKLVREEQKLIKQARKTWEKEIALKTKQEKLNNLESTQKNSNDSNLQKKINIYRKQIAKSQAKLNKAKIKLELRSKKVAEFELAIEEAIFK